MRAQKSATRPEAQLTVTFLIKKAVDDLWKRVGSGGQFPFSNTPRPIDFATTTLPLSHK